MKKELIREILIVVIWVLVRALVIMLVWNLVAPEIIWRSMEMTYWMACVISVALELMKR